MSGKKFALKKFFVTASRWMLSEYFQHAGIMLDYPIHTIDEDAYDPNALMEAHLRLSDERRRGIESAFQDVHSLDSVAGVQLLLREAADADMNLAPDFAPIQGHADRVLWTLINHPAVFHKALIWNHLNSLSRWQYCNSLPKTTPPVDGPEKKLLEQQLSDHFKNEARGDRCAVDVYSHQECIMYCAYLTDYAAAEMVFEGDKRVRRVNSRIFEVVFSYSPAEGRLGVNAAGGKPVINPLREIFVQTMLDRKPEFTLDSERVFHLDDLRRRSFQFPLKPEDSDVTVEVRRLQLYVPGMSHFVAFDPPSRNLSENSSVYDSVDRILGPAGIDIESTRVMSVTIRIKFPGKGNRGSFTFEVTQSSLRMPDNENTPKVKRYLKDWGIDPCRDA